MQEIEYMSSDGKRKLTQGWADGSTESGGGQLIVLEDGGPPKPQGQPGQPRPRRNSVELLDEELAVLDRPLEGDVEYIDEEPTSRWRRAGGFMAIVALVGVGGALMMSRNRATAGGGEQASAAAPAPAITAPTPAVTAPVLAAQVTAPAAAAPEAPPAEDGDDEEGADVSAADDGAQAAPVSQSAWTKLRGKAAPAVKQARAGGGKNRAAKARRTVVAKQGARRR